MGGRGSGRPRTRRLVDDCPRYDVMEAARLFEEEESDSDVYSTLKEHRDLWIAARRVEKDTYRVEFEWFGRRGAPRRQVVLAAPAYPHFGGVRWWWICGAGWRWEAGGWREVDGCGRRVRWVYLRKGWWGCRGCHELTYVSCWRGRSQESGASSWEGGVGEWLRREEERLRGKG